MIDDKPSVKTVTPEHCRFDYRYSHLKETSDVVVSARFVLQRGEAAAIRDRIDELLTLRKDRHPSDDHSAGCFFKNVPDPAQEHGKLPAGRLLEEVGAKELRVGGAEVFKKHANIIVNTGNATSKDIRRLADILKRKVCDRFGIELQEEIQQLGRF